MQPFCICSVSAFASGAEGQLFQFHSCSDGSNCKAKRTNLISLVVLYGCETLSLTLREERRLRVFENRVLRRTFGPKRFEVPGEEDAVGNSIVRSLMIYTVQ